MDGRSGRNGTGGHASCESGLSLLDDDYYQLVSPYQYQHQYLSTTHPLPLTYVLV
jgi:hypothetical protein